uniref:Uncharacterized protein n=1 Tax=viral metagenome TaxID=1070528 RepID=A0A6M3KGX4_9ZZZZ
MNLPLNVRGPTALTLILKRYINKFIIIRYMLRGGKIRAWLHSDIGVTKVTNRAYPCNVTQHGATWCNTRATFVTNRNHCNECNHCNEVLYE